MVQELAKYGNRLDGRRHTDQTAGHCPTSLKNNQWDTVGTARAAIFSILQRAAIANAT